MAVHGEDTKGLAKRLRELRQEMGWTLEDVAHITGVASRGVVANWESQAPNRRIPPHSVLLLLARWYGVSLDYLFGIRGSDRESPTVRMGREALRARFPTTVRSLVRSHPTARLRAAVTILQEVAPESFFSERIAAYLLMAADDFDWLLKSGEASAPVLDRFAELAGVPVRWFYDRPEDL